MQFESPLIEAILLRRYQRFLADVELPGGVTRTVHTPNTGSMQGCSTPGSRVWIRDSGDPARKYRFSWEVTETRSGVLVGINTGLANRLVRAALESGAIPEIQGYRRVRQEVRYGRERSRIDLLLEDESRGRCFVEVKNVTLAEEGAALFPDAVTLRGSKHLRELAAVVEEGDRAVILFCVQRGDADRLLPADHIDPRYGQALRQAIEAGVEALAYRAVVTLSGITLATRLPVICP